MADPPLTPSQQLYGETMTRFQLAKTDRERLRTRAQMSRALNLMLAEANVPLPSDTRWTDALGRNRDRVKDSAARLKTFPHGPKRAA